MDVVAEVGSDADLFPDIGAIGGDDGDNDNNNMNQHDQENQDDLEKAIMKARADQDQDSIMGLASLGDEGKFLNVFESPKVDSKRLLFSDSKNTFQTLVW